MHGKGKYVQTALSSVEANWGHSPTVQKPRTSAWDRAALRFTSSLLAREAVVDVLLPFAVSRLVLLGIAILAASLLPWGPFPGTWIYTENVVVDALSRWDGRWYYSILEQGYWYYPGYESNVAFSPLYPLAIAAVSMLLRLDGAALQLLAGIAISHAAFLVALGALYALVRRDHDRKVAARTVLYLCVFPSTLFFSAVYADALYLALTVVSFLLARRRQWWLAGTLGFLAALARPHGALILAPLAFEYLRQRQFRLSQVRFDAASLLLIPAGLAAWAVYLQQVTGDPSAFVGAQAAWGRGLVPPWETFARFLSAPLVLHGSSYDWSHSALDLAFTLGYGVLVALTWRLVSTTYALYATLLWLVMVSNGELAASMRYGLALFPAFIVLAIAGGNRLFHQSYLVASSSLAAVFMALFAAGYWVA